MSSEAIQGRQKAGLQAFAGEWVVLQDDEVIDHGSDLAELVERARARGTQKPYVHYVEAIEEGVFRLGL